LMGRGGSTPLDTSLSAATLYLHRIPIQFRVIPKAPVSGNERSRPSELFTALSLWERAAYYLALVTFQAPKW
jgi:hypothetical protein